MGVVKAAWHWFTHRKYSPIQLFLYSVGAGIGKAIVEAIVS